jgi:lipoprotein-anchoring transpeptidase ErfK/SrfK
MDKIKRYIGFHHINTWKKIILTLAIIIGGIFGAVFSVKAYPEVFSASLAVEKIADINPSEPIVIDFSMPMSTDDYKGKIKMIPQENYKLRWENSNKRLKIFPEKFWKPQKEYKIFLPEARNILFAKAERQTVYFSTQKYPQVSNVFPENGSENVVIGTEDPIAINFKKPLGDFSVRFILNSKIQSNFRSNSEKTQFKLLPEGGVEDGMQYELRVLAKYIKEDDNQYQEIFKSSFKTLPPAKILWDKDLSTRIDQAKKYTQAKIKTGKYIDINLSAQILSIFEEGKLLNSFMISSGKNGMNTPKIETKIYNKFPRAYSKAYGLFMPFWMAIVGDGKFGLHELPEWPSGYKEGANHLGIPVSHGCVRLGVGPAEQVYNFAEIGTPVVIY